MKPGLMQIGCVAGGRGPTVGRWLCLSSACLSGFLVFAGCRTPPALPPTDLSTPGWRVQTGQAVWRPTWNKPELAGELLLATNLNGNILVQFSKPPFPLVTAQVIGDRWEIEFGADEHRWRGTGQPPARFVWFQISRALAGHSVAQGWQFKPVATNAWRFENPRTGETLEGGFFP